MDSAKEFYIVNSDGEVINTIQNINNLVELNAGDRVLRGNSKKLLRDTKKIKYSFVKVNYTYFGEICEKVPLVGRFLPLIHYSSCMLVYENCVIVNPRNFAMSMGISLSTSRRTFRKLEQLGVIKRVQLKPNKYAYYFNPYVACRSVRIEVDTLNMFCKSIYIGEDNG